jgi:hypothetical protein
MADDNKIEIKIVTDTNAVDKSFSDISKSADKAAGSVSKSFKDAFSLEDISKFKVGFALASAAALAAAAAIAKVTSEIFHLALEGEKIGKIEKQFDVLGNQAGLSVGTLREDIVKATDGLVDITEALEVATGAIVKLGDNARQIPEIFELSRKITNVFGGEVADNFDKITQAVASGNTKAIKQVGLIVDADKAYKDLAKSLGINVDLLTQEQRQYALLNAVLDKGKTSFSGVSLSTDTLTGASTKLDVALKDLKDTGSTLANNTFGPFFKDALNSSAKAIEEFNLKLKSSGGIKLSITEQIELLNIKIEENRKFASGNIAPGLRVAVNEENLALIENITLLKGKKDAQDESSFQRGLKSQAAGTDEAAKALRLTEAQQEANAKLLLAKQQEFATASLAIKQQTLSQEISIAQQGQNESIKNQELDRLALDQKALETEASLLKEQELKTKFSAENGFLNQEANRLVEEEQSRHKAALDKIELDAKTRREATARALNKSLESIAVGGVVSSIQNTVNAILKGENALKAFGKSVLNLFGDLAIQLGTFYIAEGIAKAALFSASPGASIAAGAALVALGTVIKSVFGGTGSAASSASVESGSVGAPGGSAEDFSGEIQEKSTNVKIDVTGQVLNPIEVGNQLASILNDAFSAGGTKVVTA